MKWYHKVTSCPCICAVCLAACILCSCHADAGDAGGAPSLHADHTARHYTRELLAKYGGHLAANNSITLSIDGFESLLSHLGLGRLQESDHDDDHDEEDDHSGHVHSKLVNTPSPQAKNVHEAHANDAHVGEAQTTANSSSKCLTAREMMSEARLSDALAITEADFVALCPILVHQLDAAACRHRGALLEDVGRHKAGILNLPIKVWVCALTSVLLLSLVGLASVALVIVMQRILFNHLLQLLVALAVGSLVGDALLHLLPHALSTHRGDQHSHDVSSVWCGLVAFGGIYFFFVVERFMAIFANWRRKKMNRRIEHCKREKALMLKLPAADGHTLAEERIALKLVGQSDRSASCEEIMMVVHASKADLEKESLHYADLQLMAEEAHADRHPGCEVTAQRNHAGRPAGHSHAAAHTHGVGGGDDGQEGDGAVTVATVAWMVIMGDGLHNFCDGLAIGASFVFSINSGLSTSIAIFCHELPHELGDFAVLIRAGMSVRQACLYNCVSSALCFLGLFVGLAVGNIDVASLWIFALTAGMFLYIALVDMIPEMTSMESRSGENPLFHFVLQNIGLLIGASIMLLIALFEGDIGVPEP